MTTKLSVYNGALRNLGSRNLASLSENRESRRVLDTAWDGGFVDEILELGQWVFATRTVEISYDPSITTDFGYTYGFGKPDDFVRTAGVCQDELFQIPLLDYRDENGFWWSNLDTIYVSYISNDTSFGNDLSLWPQTFIDFAEKNLALKVCKRLTQSDNDEVILQKKVEKALVKARSIDAMADPVRFAPRGRWANARLGSQGQRYDTNGNPV